MLSSECVLSLCEYFLYVCVCCNIIGAVMVCNTVRCSLVWQLTSYPLINPIKRLKRNMLCVCVCLCVCVNTFMCVWTSLFSLTCLVVLQNRDVAWLKCAWHALIWWTVRLAGLSHVLMTVFVPTGACVVMWGSLVDGWVVWPLTTQSSKPMCVNWSLHPN